MTLVVEGLGLAMRPTARAGGSDQASEHQQSKKERCINAKRPTVAGRGGSGRR